MINIRAHLWCNQRICPSLDAIHQLNLIWDAAVLPRSCTKKSLTALTHLTSANLAIETTSLAAIRPTAVTKNAVAVAAVKNTAHVVVVVASVATMMMIAILIAADAVANVAAVAAKKENPVANIAVAKNTTEDTAAITAISNLMKQMSWTH